MSDDTKENGQEHARFRRVSSPAESSAYCENRFANSRRLQRLNRLELAFARSVMDLAGNEVSILDAPCGSGRFFEIFSPARKLTMLDFNDSMLKVVQEKYGQGKPLNLVQGDISALPFENESFDLVFSMRLLHHVGEDELRRKIIGELARVSRRYVALSVYSKSSLRYLKRRLRGKLAAGYAVSLGTFTAEAQQAGLKLLRKYPAVSFVEQQRMLLFEKVRPGVR